MSLAYLAPLLSTIKTPPSDMVRAASSGLGIAARPIAIAAHFQHRQSSLLIVTPRADSAERLAVGLSAVMPPDNQPIVWGAPDPLPYEQLPHDVELSVERVAILDRLHRAGDHPVVVVASLRGLLSYIRSPESLARDIISLSGGDRLSDRSLITRLVNAGYEPLPVADRPGGFARRGGIVDIYPTGSQNGLRVEFFGDEIESLRDFDATTQRSTGRRDTARILPPFEFDPASFQEAADKINALDLSTLRPEVADEWQSMIESLAAGELPDSIDLLASLSSANRSSVLDYLPTNSSAVLIDPGAIAVEVDQLEIHADEVRSALETAGEIPRDLPRAFPGWPSVNDHIDRWPQWQIGGGATGPEFRSRESFVEPPMFPGNVEAAINEVVHRSQGGWRIVVATDQSERVADLLAERDVFPRVVKRAGTSPAEPPLVGSIDVVHAPIEAGFGLVDPPTLVVSDRELFGVRKTLRRPVRARRPRHRPRHAFSPGDYVVHVEHGVGQFAGLVPLQTSGVEREYLQIEYAEGDKLYVPVDQTDRVAPYEAPAGSPRITRLSSPDWSRTKARVRESVREMAYELLQIYAAREVATGHAFDADTPWDTELAESFPFRETTEQLRAIEDVKGDLEEGQPMDRLICGDVGYGKTEVALRAAFKVVNDGWQVAILVPTTVLALQHYETFRDRLAAFPVRVEMLSRLRSHAEQTKILKALESGEVDIVIGTHRLVQKDVRFHRLGLLVVDEEQRFGVRHKEYIKQQRAEIDVLTMTATPIPRTLHMALTGLRDLSLITTPPQERVPIRTFVTPSDDTVVREAILREMQRGGQIYVVHNRVQSIHRVRAWLEELVPEASIAVGHGQMDERELEQVILAFMRQEFDILVCTTIIESGVDIPNVNTIIIDNAHALGLTQLYQLRGRVGRSSTRAYAYLLYPPRTPLSAEARQRLAAIQEATELGAGFQIAMRDMEIRGAGNVLGGEQSGHIASVGLDLYTRMLSHAIEEIRSGRPIIEPDEVNIDIAVDSRIPPEYIDDENLRLSIYHRISSARTPAELGDARRELTDRFGEIPAEVEAIFDLVRLRHHASELGITSIIERDAELFIRPVVGGRLNQTELRRKLGPGIRITPNLVRMKLSELGIDRWKAIDAILAELDEIKAQIAVGSSSPASPV